MTNQDQFRHYLSPPELPGEGIPQKIANHPPSQTSADSRFGALPIARSTAWGLYRGNQQGVHSFANQGKPDQTGEIGSITHDFFGRHFMASYLNCAPGALRDLAGLRDAFRRATDASGATVLGSAEQVFDLTGLTLILLLSESHASIHTYPECNACFVDLFTCGHRCEPEPFDAALRDYLRPDISECQTILRDRVIRVERDGAGRPTAQGMGSLPL